VTIFLNGIIQNQITPSVLSSTPYQFTNAYRKDPDILPAWFGCLQNNISSSGVEFGFQYWSGD